MASDDQTPVINEAGIKDTSIDLGKENKTVTKKIDLPFKEE